MLNIMQKTILSAYGVAQLVSQSHAVMYHDYKEIYVICSCENVISNYEDGYSIVDWQHPNVTPCWNEYDIEPEEFSEYMHKHFSILYPEEERQV